MDEQQLLHSAPMLPVSLLRRVLQQSGGLRGDQPTVVRVVARAGVQEIQLEPEMKPLGVRFVARCPCGRRALRLRLDPASGWWRCSRCSALRSARTTRRNSPLFKEVVVPALDLAHERRRMNGMRTTTAQRTAFAAREEAVMAKIKSSVAKALKLEKFGALLDGADRERRSSPRTASSSENGQNGDADADASEGGQAAGAASRQPRSRPLMDLVLAAMSPPLEVPAPVIAEEQRMAQLFLDLVEQHGVARDAPWSYGHDGSAFDAAINAIPRLLIIACEPNPSGEGTVLATIRAGFVKRLIMRLWRLRERKPRRSAVLLILREAAGKAAISRAPVGQPVAGGGSRG